MKRTFLDVFLLGFAVALLIVSLVSNEPTPVRAASQGQYKVVSLPTRFGLEGALNKHAAEGWEFLAVTRTGAGSDHFVIFKR